MAGVTAGGLPLVIIDDDGKPLQTSPAGWPIPSNLIEGEPLLAHLERVIV